MSRPKDEIAEAFEHGCDMPDCTERVIDTIHQHPEDLEEALATLKHLSTEE